MGTTIKQMAEKAGVSIGTISRALKNDPKVALATREKIHALADKLDYVPNHVGRALQSSKSFLIGYLISNLTYSFYNEIVQGIGSAANKAGYGVLMGITDDDPGKEIEQLKFFREKAVDGIIVSNFLPGTIPYLEKIRTQGTPLVICDFKTFNASVPTVMVDEKKASAMLVNHLVDLGHEKLGFCFHVNDNSLERYEYCRELIREKGLPDPVLYKDMAVLLEGFENNDFPSGIICYSDLHAIEVKHAAEGFDLRISKDISITGFDDIALASWPEFSITTIAQPKAQLGVYAAEMLFDMINGQNNMKSKILQPELILRKSTGLNK